MFLAGSWFLWSPPNLPEVSNVTCLCSCSRTFYSTSHPFGHTAHQPCSRWLVSLLTSVLASTTHKAGIDTIIFLTFWNSVKFNFHNKLLLEHSYVLPSHVFKGRFYISEAELSNLKSHDPQAVSVYIFWGLLIHTLYPFSHLSCTTT